MATQVYTPKPFMNLREAIEHAIVLARASNSQIIISMNDVRFSVDPDTPIQTAIDTYLEVQKKMFETTKQLKQKTK